MEESVNPQWESVLRRIKSQAAAEQLRVTQHAHEEMVEEGIKLAEVLQALQNSAGLEDYSAHRRWACCLLNGFTQQGRALHIVCTTDRPVLIVITVYEPKPPKWTSPTERSRRP